jgi:hypothetical protein
MPQLKFGSGQRTTAVRLQLLIDTDPVNPDICRVSVYAMNVLGDVMTSASAAFEGLAADYVSDAVKAVVEAYQWGEAVLAPCSALKHVAKRARQDVDRITKDRMLSI